MKTPVISRRSFHIASAAGLLGALLPASLGATGGNDRRFLFIYAVGGWDPTWVFHYGKESNYVDADPNGSLAEANGISFVDSPQRPSVRSFFQNYGSQSCIINGFEVRSVTHERCRRLLFTGSTGDVADDWPARIASANTGESPIFPCLVLSGPSYTSLDSAMVVRVGEHGQLSGLLDGSAFEEMEDPVIPPSTASTEKIQAFLEARAANLAGKTTQGQAARYANGLSVAVQQAAAARNMSGDIDLTGTASGIAAVSERVVPGLAALAQGLSRCVVIQHAGQFDVGWDSHTNLQAQSIHFEILFQDLNAIMADLHTRTDPSGTPLIESTTVVVFSEMGRTPQLNPGGGKDHWTWTSALLMGAGVQGGQVVGAFDEQLMGLPIDLNNGLPDESGTSLTSENIGATLLKLAGLDPSEATNAQAIQGVVR